MIRKISEKQKIKNEIKKYETLRLHTLFQEIWDERQDKDGYCYCFETGTRMHRTQYRNLSTVYDHVLEKNANAFPEYKFTRANIIIVLPEIHAQKTKDISKTPKIWKYRDELLLLHYEGKLK